jgi:hypothetical protein
MILSDKFHHNFFHLPYFVGKSSGIRRKELIFVGYDAQNQEVLYEVKPISKSLFNFVRFDISDDRSDLYSQSSSVIGCFFHFLS